MRFSETVQTHMTQAIVPCPIQRLGKLTSHNLGKSSFSTGIYSLPFHIYANCHKQTYSVKPFCIFLGIF